MQLEEIQIPIYFGGFIDVFWDSDGIIRVDTERDRLSICANGPALAALAKQLLYFSCNNSDYLQKARKYGHFTGYKN